MRPVSSGPLNECIRIGARDVGPKAPCFIIAEAGVNHNGSLDAALRLVESAYDAGADAVKFQTFTAEGLATLDAPKAEYQKRSTGTSESQFEMLQALELSPAAHRTILERCRKLGILLLSSPFDEASVDLLALLGVPALKVSSGELTNLSLLQYIVSKGKPVILSTGMARLGEVETALAAMSESGAKDIVLLHCVSNYPANPKDVNLRAMKTMADAFRVPVGYSDHTMGPEVALAAVALGASVVEKHLTLSRTLPGPDHHASMEPAEFSALVRGIRVVEAALGDGRKCPAVSEIATARVARRSLVAAVDIPEGCVLHDAHLQLRRPGTGLAPEMRPFIVGRTARALIRKGTVIGFEMLA